MSREKQTAMQFASWITKERWTPLLNRFNQNKSEKEDWDILFNEAKKHNIQEKWARYIDFFEKHLANSMLEKGAFSPDSDKRKCFWILFNVACPAFFEKAIPLLDSEQRADFRQKAVDWIVPWLYEKEFLPTVDSNSSFSTIFKLLISLDAPDAWISIKQSMYATYITGLLKHTVGKELHWVQGLRETYIAEGNTFDSWRLALFKNDCIEHLLSEDAPLPVAHALLAHAELYRQNSNVASEEALSAMFRRLPHLRVWVAQASGEDAQACRSILEIPEIDTTKSDVAKAIDIGRSLGLELNALADFLDTATLKIDNTLIEPHIFEELLLDNTSFQK